MRRGAVIVVACLSCGGPLDRVDGALSIVLAEAPAEVDLVEVDVRAGGRTFSARVSHPEDGRIDVFSAVPIGAAQVDLSLFAGARLVDQKVDLHVQIEEGARSELVADFSVPDWIDVKSPVLGYAQHIADGPVIIRVDAFDASLDLTVTARAGDMPIELLVTTVGTWVGEIDPKSLSDRLPATLELVVEVCLRARCAEVRRDIEIHRRVWRTTVEGRPLEPSVLGGDIVLPVADGDLHIFRADGSSRIESLGFDIAGVVADEDALYVAGADRVLALEAGGLGSRWSVPIDGPMGVPSVSADALFLGVGAELVRFALEDGTQETLHRFTSPVQSRATADPTGVAAVSLSGELWSTTGVEASLAEPTLASPLRLGPDIIVISAAGRYVRVGPDGAPKIDRGLGAPVVHTPLSCGPRVCIAAGDRLVFMDGEELSAQVLPAPLTAPPVGWEDRVLLGLADGRIVITAPTPEATHHVVSRLPGAVRAVRPVSPTTVFAVGSRGDIAMIRIEEGFP